MSERVVQLWQQVLNRLPRIARGGIAAFEGFSELLQELHSMVPQQPAATWRAFIQDMQVCGLL